MPNYFSYGAERANIWYDALIILAKIIDADDHRSFYFTVLTPETNVADVACFLYINNAHFSRLAKFSHDSSYI